MRRFNDKVSGAGGYLVFPKPAPVVSEGADIWVTKRDGGLRFTMSGYRGSLGTTEASTCSGRSDGLVYTLLYEAPRLNQNGPDALTPRHVYLDLSLVPAARTPHHTPVSFVSCGLRALVCLLSSFRGPLRVTVPSCVRLFIVVFCAPLCDPLLSLKLGEDGLLPATRFMSRVQQHLAHLTPWEKVLKVSEGARTTAAARAVL